MAGGQDARRKIISFLDYSFFLLPRHGCCDAPAIESNTRLHLTRVLSRIVELDADGTD